MTEHGDETLEQQRIKGTIPERDSYQKGQNYLWKEKRVNKPKMTE